MTETGAIIGEYQAFLGNKAFPCVGAKAALAGGHIRCLVAAHMACPADDEDILQFLYDFVDEYRQAPGHGFYSAAILFKEPVLLDELRFDAMLWARLQSLARLDGRNYGHDRRVSADPSSAHYSFSLKEEAFFIIGQHPASSRPARKFKYPALAFNPHAQFERLRQADKYETLKSVVRKRDIAYSGSVNPMLEDFGQSSEVYQYSGLNYDDQWRCPLNNKHAKDEHHPPS
jgi:FPC/CPF motif-containing protein YcgG